MNSYILRADNPSKLSNTLYVYYTGDGWDTSIEKVIYYFKREDAEEALNLVDSIALNITIEEITSDGPKVDAVDGDDDGLFEDGTVFERPIEVKTVKKRAYTKKKDINK